MPQDGLDIEQGQVLVPAHPQGGGVPQVVHRVVGAEHRVEPAEHRPQGLVVHRLKARSVPTVTASKRPPDQVVRPQGTELGQVEAEPDERIRTGRQPLCVIAALAVDPYQLISPVQVDAAKAESLTGPGGVADVQREECAVPVGTQSGERSFQRSSGISRGLLLGILGL